MPRDDLTIDFVERMPAQESVDPAQILDDFFYRFQNIPEEIRFIQAEIADKDRVVGESLRAIEDRDAKIQRWIRTNGGHVPNPREESLRAQIRENYARAQKSSDEKLALAEKLQVLYDRQILYLDRQIKGLTDRAEPGFTDPDEIPSLLRNSAANIPAPSFRTTGGARGGAAAASSKPSTPANATNTPTLLIANKTAASQIRNAQAQQQHAASAPATPAASMVSRSARETSAGPGSGVPKRGPRANAVLNGVPPSMPGGLARHSSLGPGPTKSATATGAGGAVRAGSAGPRTSTAKAAGAGGVGRKGTPGAPGRKKTTGAAAGAPGANKSSLFRVKKASSKNSPASADSDLSDAESASAADEEPEKRGGAGSGSGSQRAGSGTPSRGGGAAGTQNGGGTGPAGGRGVVRGGAREDAEMGDAEDEEAGDDSKYCLCQNVSFGDMVACDNDECPYEWFHWSCVGLKNEPNGKWFCPVCTGKKAK